MVGFLHCSWKYLIPSTMLYLYKSQIRPEMKYCCHSWTWAAQSSLPSLDKVQNCVCSFMDTVPIPQMSQACCYATNTSIEKIYMCAPFFSTTNSSLYVHNPSYYVHWVESHSFLMYSFDKKDVPFQKLLPKNRLPCGCFPKHYNLSLYKSRVSCYLSTITLLSFFTSYSYVHILPHLIQ